MSGRAMTTARRPAALRTLLSAHAGTRVLGALVLVALLGLAVGWALA